MVPTLLVCRGAWDLSMAVADVNTHVIYLGVLLESPTLRSQEYRHDCIYWLGLRYLQ
ncbi:hypothetical protein THOG05_310029 [Vibrio rotiferianus]|nr:hypothetical protein THOG05_310029 [Vibrio rotiferianus]